MRYVFGFLCVCALGVMPLVGCSETTGDGGSGGDAGSGGTAGDGGSGGMAGNGGAAGTGGMAGSGGTGGMPECQSPEDCDDGNDCTANACTDGMCEYTAVTDDTACDESNECAVGQCASGACELTPVTNGTACGDDAGTCQDGACEVACNEQGIRDAIAAGGGPYRFDCNGPQTVVTEAEIVIDNDVVLDGEGKLTVDGDESHRVFSMTDVTAELRGFTVTRGVVVDGCCAAGIESGGSLTLVESRVSGNLGVGIMTGGGETLTLTDSTVSDNDGVGIDIWGGETTLVNSTVSGNSGGGINACPPLAFGSSPLTLINSTVSGNTALADSGGGGICGGEPLTLINSTVSDNSADYGGGIIFGIDATLINSTVSGNTAATDGGGILAIDRLRLINSTVSGNTAVRGDAIYDSAVEATATVIDGTCGRQGPTISKGYNIESPGNTCGFDPDGTDLVDVPDPMLGPLQDNGGPTETHALLPGSPALDRIPAVDCEVTEDQRGVARPQGPACDVGAFELEVVP
jgi:parallel beta-helix repeat protein